MAATLLAFDVGSRRTGVAVGQTVTASARGLTTLTCRDAQPDWDEIAALLDEWQPSALVVGIPRHADGSASHSTRIAEKFARRLEGRFGLPVHRIDERLSSHAADERLRSPGRSLGSPGGDGARDAEAAAVILETWFAEEGKG